jgi:hypothetical protein
VVNLNLVPIIKFILVVLFELFDSCTIVRLFERELAGDLTCNDLAINCAAKTLVIKFLDFIIAIICVDIKIKCPFFLKINSTIVILMSPGQILLCIIVSNMVDGGDHICLQVPTGQVWEGDV